MITWSSPSSCTAVRASINALASSTGMFGGTRTGAAFPGCGFRSSSDRMELRGACSFASRNAQPRGEMLTALTPFGPASAFCAPIAAKSTAHSSTSRASPPTADTESSTVIRLCFRASSRIALAGLEPPVTTSAWTKDIASGLCCSIAAATSSAVTTSSNGTFTSVTAAPPRSSHPPNRLP
ncbi:hypothetical protein D3C73_1220260 [compost metagenome]